MDLILGLGLSFRLVQGGSEKSKFEPALLAERSYHKLSLLTQLLEADLLTFVFLSVYCGGSFQSGPQRNWAG